MILFTANAEGAEGVEVRERTSAHAQVGKFGPEIVIKHAGFGYTFVIDTPKTREGIKQEFGCEVQDDH